MRITAEEFQRDARALWELLRSRFPGDLRVAPVPRGGYPVGSYLAALPGVTLTGLDDPDAIVVDDLVDSGRTLAATAAGRPTAALYVKPYAPRPTLYVREISGWIHLPWEAGEAPAEDAVVRLLEALGEDPTREGLLETPRRVVGALRELTTPRQFTFTVFPAETDQMVIVRDIPFTSLCEHHLLPFHGVAHVAYVPGSTIAGLSKLARTVELFAHRLQNQERLTGQVADYLVERLTPRGVAVQMRAEHLCMAFRGVRSQGAVTITTALRGVLREDASARAEFLAAVA